MTRAPRWPVRLLIPAAACMVAFASGCATTAMKGTPFYSGEYQKPRGPAEDRINLWPLTYYREPALSVLWPFVESVQDESFAIRPFYSVYDMNDDRLRERNILWPLIQTDHSTGTGRAIPFFWSDDYVIGFPLYWRFDRPGGRRDLMLPLWWYDRGGRHYSFYTLLGLAGARHTSKSDSQYLFPVGGNFHRADGSTYRYQLWPLSHQFSAADGSHGNALLPLWYWNEASDSSTFITLPWSQGETAQGDAWQLLFPLYYHRQSTDSRALITLLGGSRSSPEQTSWIAPLLLSGGRRGEAGTNAWLLAGLAHWGTVGSNSSSHVLPFYYAARTPEDQRFYSLPWSSARHADGSAWQLVPPLYFHRTNCQGGATYSPIYSSRWSAADSNAWQLLLPVYYHQQSTNSTRTLTPLYASGYTRQHDASWRTVIPLFYSEHDRDGDLLATLIGGYRREGDGHTWMVYPLLTWNRHRGTTNDFWALAPLVHVRREGSTTTRSHVLPLYYRNGSNGTFVSPAYARWGDTNATHQMLPWLLSWRTEQAKVTDDWLLGGLARRSSGLEAGPSYLLPLYYRNPKTRTVLSPVYCRWGREERSTALIPPLLGASSRSADGTRDLWALGGLYHHEWDADGARGDRLFPLYAYAQSNYFYTPLFGSRDRDGSRFAYYATPLIGSRHEGTTSSHWFFPLYSRTTDRLTKSARGHVLWGGFNRSANTSHSSFFPLYGFTDHGPKKRVTTNSTYQIAGTDFLCLPWCWRTDLRTSYPTTASASEDIAVADEYSHGAFPLWSYTRTRNQCGELTARGSFLLALYDSYREVRPLASAPNGTNVYIRKRVLWHVWHYEKLNGDVTVDMLPGITYDRKKDGFRQYSFLWRVFRWERDAEGRRKLDILFVPLLRDKKPAGAKVERVASSEPERTKPQGELASRPIPRHEPVRQ